MLCHVFSETLYNFPSATERRRYPHHRTFAQLKEASEAGCYVCFSFWNLYSEEQQNALCQLDLDKKPCTEYYIGNASLHDPSNQDDHQLWVTSSNVPKSIATESLVIFDISPLREEGEGEGMHVQAGGELILGSIY